MSSLNPILAAAKQSSGDVAFAQQDLNDITSSEIDLANQNAGLQLDLGAAQTVINTATATAKLQAQDDATNFSLAIGGDLGDASGTMRHLADTFNKAESDKEQALLAVNAKRNISPLDDLIGWIGAQFSINDDINKYNSSLAVANQAKSHIDDINEMVSKRAIADAQLEHTVTQGSIDAAAKVTADAAQINANTEKSKALVANATNVKEQVNLSVQQLEIQSRVQSAEIQQQQLGIAQAHLKIAQDQAAEVLSQKKDKDEINKVISDRIYRGLQQLNPTLADQIIKSPATMAMIKGGANSLDPRLAEAYRIGSLNEIANPSGKTRLLATTPTEALQVLQFSPEIAPAQRPMVDLLIQAKSDLEQNKAGTFSAAYQAAVQAKDKDQASKVFNEYANTLLNAQSKRVDGPANPFYLPAINKLSDQTPALKQFKLQSVVIDPAIKANVDLSDPGKVLDYTINAIKNGQIGMNEAVSDLATYYKQGAVVNTQARTMVGFGFTPKISYNSSYTSAGGFTRTVDFTDARSLMSTMSSILAGQAMDQQTKEGLTPTIVP